MDDSRPTSEAEFSSITDENECYRSSSLRMVSTQLLSQTYIDLVDSTANVEHILGVNHAMIMGTRVHPSNNQPAIQAVSFVEYSISINLHTSSSKCVVVFPSYLCTTDILNVSTPNVVRCNPQPHEELQPFFQLEMANLHWLRWGRPWDMEQEGEKGRRAAWRRLLPKLVASRRIWLTCSHSTRTAAYQWCWNAFLVKCTICHPASIHPPAIISMCCKTGYNSCVNS